MAQKILQAGLSSGMSTASGIHSDKPSRVSEDYDGLKHVLSSDFVPQTSTKYTLRTRDGKDVQIPLISWGAWPWGDTATFHWSDAELPTLHAAWKQCLSQGQTWVDTAQVYGSGKSEEILGDLIHNHSPGVSRSQIVVQTKWLPMVTDAAKNLVPGVDAPVQALHASLKRMRLDYIDCYLVHGHVHATSISSVAQSLAKCVEDGLTKAVGVANYSVKDMLKMRDELQKYNIPLATNQCEYSILRRLPETEGMLEACRENGIVFQSYSSLAQGRLSGKYTEENPAPKEYRFSSYPMEDIEPTLDVQRKIAEKHNVSVAAVALNWNILKGAIPVVGMRKESQAEENMQALGWRLSNDEIKELDAVGFEGQTTKLWQQG
ncbi:MAG: hypothetical protein M1820_008269 [Bogoriella megaspora]|nr:MAG: hypothetical protein M1820_008269 [Bogoriella megaspora]